MSDAKIDRRTFLKDVGLAALAATAAGPFLDSAGEEAVPFSSGTEQPRLEAPWNTCDCHMHIYDSRFPPAPSATLFPPDAHPSYYRLLQARLRTTRNVVVQPSTYGTDNRCTLDALEQIGPTARAVAVVDTSVTDSELHRLDRLGVRGIRFNLVQAGATTADMIEPLSKRVNELGWHVQIHMLGDQIVQIQDILKRLPSRIVFDHFGRIPGSAGVGHPAFGVIRGLLDGGRTYVKLSSAYLNSKVGAPSYSDMTELAHAFVKAAPERMLFGTDWPHPTEKTHKPDDAVLFDLWTTWVPDESTRNRIFVGNPQALYDFPRKAG